MSKVKKVIDFQLKQQEIFQKEIQSLKGKDLESMSKADQKKLFMQVKKIDKKLDDLFEEIEKFKSQKSSDDMVGTLWLNDILEKEDIKFGSNNLILAPVGSGKSFAIRNYFTKDSTETYLLLVSTTSLKDSLEKDKKNNKTFTTQNKCSYSFDKRFHVMSYKEFGIRIENNDDFAEQFNKIFCDEVHSLVEYKQMGNNQIDAHYTLAQKYLFNQYENQQIFYFTATNQYLLKLEKTVPEISRYTTTHDFLNYPNIKKYIQKSEYHIDHISQLSDHLKARKTAFDNGFKGLGFAKRISEMRDIEKICLDNGLVPLVLWSVHNTKHEMSPAQISARNEILKTGNIPKPYNFLIINSSMQEGWDLNDKMMDFCVINSITLTEQVQALGRIRKNIDVVVLRKRKPKNKNRFILIPDEYLNIELTTEDKTELCETVNHENSQGRLLKWSSIKNIITKIGYNVKEKQIRIDGKVTRVSIITK